MPPRVAILPPVPVPYREPLFRALAERGRIDPYVLYLSASQPGWDQPSGWFSEAEGYGSEILGGRQHSRTGRSPITFPRGLAAGLKGLRADCIVSWEYGPATLRALAWARRRRVPVLVFSELTPWSDAALSGLQRRAHGVVAPRAAGFIVASSQGVERLRGLGVARERIEVALQSAELGALRAARRASRWTRCAFSLWAGWWRTRTSGRSSPRSQRRALRRVRPSWSFGGGSAGGGAAGPGRPARGAGPLSGPRVGRRARRRLFGRGRPGAGQHLRALRGHAARGRRGRAAADRVTPGGAVGDVAVDGENAIVIDPDDGGQIVSALTRLVREPDLRERLAAGSAAVTERHPLEADVEAWERAVLRVARD